MHLWIQWTHLGAAVGMFLYSLTMWFLRDVYRDRTQIVIGTAFGLAAVATAGQVMFHWQFTRGWPATLVGVGSFALAISTVRFIGRQKARDTHGSD